MKNQLTSGQKNQLPFPVFGKIKVLKANFSNFLLKYLKNLKIWKIRLLPVRKINFRFRFKLFSIFRPHFDQLFAKRRVKPWKFWKISWFRPTSGGNRTTSGWKSKEIGQIFQTFCQKLVKFLGLGTFLMLKKVLPK